MSTFVEEKLNCNHNNKITISMYVVTLISYISDHESHNIGIYSSKMKAINAIQKSCMGYTEKKDFISNGLKMICNKNIENLPDNIFNSLIQTNKFPENPEFGIWWEISERVLNE